MRGRLQCALAICAISVGCGPISAGTLLIQAGAEVSAAKNAQAEENAPYEYTAAEQYLHKARHDHSYANFETAEEFAKKSRDCARLARVRAESKTRRNLGASSLEIPRNLTCHAGTLAPTVVRSAEPLPPVDEPKDPPSDEPSDPEPIELPAGDDPLPPGDGEDRK